MEKTIKMSLDTAQKLWKVCNDMSVPTRYGECPSRREPTEYEILIRDILLTNFTKEELEGKKGFTWEESFSGDGYYIDQTTAEIKTVKNYVQGEYNSATNVFKTHKQALSAIAFAQLSHIVAKYNEGKVVSKPYYIIQPDSEGIGSLIIRQSRTPHQLYFVFKSDADISLEVNRELWSQYWMIK